MTKRVLAIVGMAVSFAVPPVLGQVGQGVLDVNIVATDQLAELPNLTPAIAEGLIGARPFASALALDGQLRSAGLSEAQRAELYAAAFVHVNLNTASREEFMLIPGVGRRMAHEFDEYRPWKSWSQFDREIGKYVDQAEVDRLKRFVFIPLDLNTATDEQFRTIPGVGKRMAHEFEEYRPWRSKQQFEREIGKYVDEREVARLWRYVEIRE